MLELFQHIAAGPGRGDFRRLKAPTRMKNEALYRRRSLINRHPAINAATPQAPGTIDHDLSHPAALRSCAFFPAPYVYAHCRSCPDNNRCPRVRQAKKVGRLSLKHYQHLSMSEITA